MGKFPNFTDGDVEIILAKQATYQLHSSVLTQHSAVMEDLLDLEDVALQAVKKGATVHCKLVLVANHGGVEENGTDINCIFAPILLDERGRIVGGDPNLAAFDVDENEDLLPTFRAYDNVLRALYNVKMSIGNAQQDDFNGMLTDALGIASVAEYLECTPAITQAIESTLLATGQHLYHGISQEPALWLSFANCIHSKAIFKEALIHAAGQFHTSKLQDALASIDDLPSLRGLTDVVIATLVEEANSIKSNVKKAEAQLISYYPEMLKRERPSAAGDREAISRASYGNDIFCWMALCLFRHWLGGQMAADRTHAAQDMGWKFINTISLGGDAYLDKTSLNSGFHMRFPMSAKASLCIQQRLDEIKKVAKQWAVGMLKNKSQYEPADTTIKYFTNIDVVEGDYPWVTVGENDYDDDAGGSDVQQSIKHGEEANEVQGKGKARMDQYGLDGATEDDTENMVDIRELDRIAPFLNDDGEEDLDGIPLYNDIDNREPMSDPDGDPGNSTFDGVPIHDREPLSDIEEDLHDNPTDEDEIAARRTEHELDMAAARQLLSLNSDRPTSSRNDRGDTEPMDDELYRSYCEARRREREQQPERESVEEARRGKRKATDYPE